jgi:chromosome segregation ATPase
MTETEDLGRLESVVEKLLADFNSLKNDKNELENLLEQKNNEINELQSALDEVRSERNQVQQRVSGILNSIEQWEQSQMPDEKTEAQEEGSGEKPDSSPQLFSMGR